MVGAATNLFSLVLVPPLLSPLPLCPVIVIVIVIVIISRCKGALPEYVCIVCYGRDGVSSYRETAVLY
jgi:hypothetical protein